MKYLPGSKPRQALVTVTSTEVHSLRIQRVGHILHSIALQLVAPGTSAPCLATSRYVFKTAPCPVTSPPSLEKKASPQVNPTPEHFHTTAHSNSTTN